MKKSISRVVKKTGIKKGITILTSLALLIATLVACTNSNTTSPTASTENSSSKFDPSHEITVVSREDGSGTRGAFIELFGIEEKTADGKKIDHTTEEATIAGNTATMMTTVANSEYSIGYVSLGSLNKTIKAVKIDGAEANQGNVKAGSYKIVRPFNIVTKSGISEVAKDFIHFILSTEGQKVVADNGYIAIDDVKAFTGGKATGKIVVAGSSSVSPVMEKLKEAYMAVNKGANVEVQTSDSTTGVTSAIDGTCEIGMASRDLKDTEKEKGVSSTVIAKDGIAVIVNNESSVTELTSAQVKSIFVGETTEWNEVIK